MMAQIYLFEMGHRIWLEEGPREIYDVITYDISRMNEKINFPRLSKKR